MNILRWLQTSTKRQLQRPLLRLGITLLLNFCIAGIIIAWIFMQYKQIDGELRALDAAAFLTTDNNGVYLSLLPPQTHLAGKSLIRLRDYPTSRPFRSTIERNLSRNKQQFTAPGVAVWWSTQSRQSYDRIVFRFRYPFLLTVVLVLRFGLHRTCLADRDRGTTPTASRSATDS